MTKTKTTKKALLLSVFSTLVCCAMLAGSTFAWFSDEATAGNIKITAGNLDVELQDSDGEELTELSFKGATKGDDVYTVEPGVMFVSDEFKVVNKGTLALAYELSAKTTENTATSDGYTLDQVIKMKVVTVDALLAAIADAGIEDVEDLDSLPSNLTKTQRDDIWKNLDGAGDPVGTHSESGVILPKGADESNTPVGETDPQVIVLYWEPYDSTDTDPEKNPDNYYNVKDSSAKPSITFGVEVFATQTPYEEDSFGENYDAGAIEAHAITAVFVEKVGGLTDELSTLLSNVSEDYADAVTVELDETEDGTVGATFTFGDAFTEEAQGTSSDNTKAMSSAFTATASKIAETLWSEKDNISTLTITGTETKTVNFAEVATEDALRSALGGALTNAVAKNIASVVDNQIKLTVDVVTKAGATVSYDLVFDFSVSGVVSSDNRIGTGYVVALAKALQGWMSDGEIHDGT